MFRYSIRTLLAIVLIVGILCAVLIAFPLWLRVVTLFIGVIALPGPLIVTLRRGGPASKSFALGGLGAYAFWFALIGVPCAFAATSHFDHFWNMINAWDGASGFGSAIGIGGGFGAILPDPSVKYLLFAGIYAPWLIVLLASLMSLLVHWLLQPRRTDSPDKASA